MRLAASEYLHWDCRLEQAIHWGLVRSHYSKRSTGCCFRATHRHTKAASTMKDVHTLVFLFLQASQAFVVLEPRLCALVEVVVDEDETALDTDNLRDVDPILESIFIDGLVDYRCDR